MGAGNPLNTQFSSVLIVLVAGMFLGVIVDLYRVLRGIIIGNNRHYRGLVNFIGDLCFWGLALVLVTPILFWGTWLELRFYVWLLMLAGLVLYFGVFSPVLIPLYLSFWRIIIWTPKELVTKIWRFKNYLKKCAWRITARFSKSE